MCCRAAKTSGAQYVQTCIVPLIDEIHSKKLAIEVLNLSLSLLLTGLRYSLMLQVDPLRILGKKIDIETRIQPLLYTLSLSRI